MGVLSSVRGLVLWGLSLAGVVRRRKVLLRLHNVDDVFSVCSERFSSD